MWHATGRWRWADPDVRSAARILLPSPVQQSALPPPEAVSFSNLISPSHTCIQLCKPGAYVDVEGSTRCTPCPAGAHSSVWGAVKAEACQASSTHALLQQHLQGTP